MSGLAPFAEDCRRCPALAANRRRIVHGYGAVPARVLLVGEAPGYRGGDVTGVPFTRDRSGVRLQKLLIALGLSAESDPRAERPRLSCFITNIVRCNPPANRDPTPAEVESCLPYLWQDIEAVQPDIVVPIGRHAADAVFRRLLARPAPAILQAHARVFETGAAHPGLVIPARHPARCSNADLTRLGAVLRAALAGAER